MDRNEKLKTISKPKQIITKIKASDTDVDPFKRRGSVSRSPPSSCGVAGKLNPNSVLPLERGREVLQSEKKRQEKRAADADIHITYASEQLDKVRSSLVLSDDEMDNSGEDKLTHALSEKYIKLKDVQKERALLEEFLFNDNNKISKSAIKYILSKWMFLEGKLQEEILEKEKLKNTCQELQKSTITKTYANVASAPWSDPTLKPSKPVAQSILLIRPEKETDIRDNEEIKSDFCKLLEKQKSKIKIKSIRKMRNKGLVAELDSDDDIKIVQDSELSKIELKAEVPIKSGPTIIIYDMDKALSKEEIVEQIIMKNVDGSNIDKDMLREKIKCRFNIKTKNINKINWVIELPPEIYKILIRKERVYIGFLSYRVKTFVNITRCFKCYGYGHSAKTCTMENQLCEKCGEEGHLKSNCSSKKSYCINCKKGRRKEIEHSVKDVKCPEYLKQLDLFYKRTKWT